jgi:ppGpp synthetase/RelA/SpoT-type nucleotidyltranferase
MEQERAISAIQKAFAAECSVVDRRKNPSYGYRAVHVIVEVSKKPVEVQIRTSLQDLWAELSEKRADTVDPAIKYGGGPSTEQGRLDRISRAIKGIEEFELDLARDRAEIGSAPEKHNERALNEVMEETVKSSRRILRDALTEMQDLPPGE